MKYVIPFIICLTFISAGCTSGPLRYKILGNRTYGTVEFTKRSTPIIKPIAAVAGLIVDTGLIVTDTVITPVVAISCSIIGSAKFGSWGMGKNRGFSRVYITFILMPYLMYAFGYGYIDNTMGFGREAAWLKEPPAQELKTNEMSGE